MGRGGWAPGSAQLPDITSAITSGGSLPCSPSTLCSSGCLPSFWNILPNICLAGCATSLRPVLRSHFAGPSWLGGHLPVPCRSPNWVIRQGLGLGLRPRVPGTKDSAWSPWRLLVPWGQGGGRGWAELPAGSACFSPCPLLWAAGETLQERLLGGAPWRAHVPDQSKLLEGSAALPGGTQPTGGQSRGAEAGWGPDPQHPLPCLGGHAQSTPGKKLCPHLSGSPHRGKLRLTEVG